MSTLFCCARTDCPAGVTEHGTYCSPDCALIAAGQRQMPRIDGAAPVTAKACVAAAWPWLDIRAAS